MCKMKAFIVVSCLVLAASAKPQGYVYNPPGTGISLTLMPPSGSSHQSFSVSGIFDYYFSLLKTKYIFAALFYQV